MHAPCAISYITINSEGLGGGGGGGGEGRGDCHKRIITGFLMGILCIQLDWTYHTSVSTPLGYVSKGYLFP